MAGLRIRASVIVAIAAVILAFRGQDEGPPSGLTAEQESRLRHAAQLRGRAQADMEDGNYGRAVDTLQELATLLPDNILPPVNLAICLFRLDRPDQAVRQIRRAQALDPDNPQMLFTLARILEERPEREQEWSEVIDHFARVQPRDPRPHYLRAERAARERRWKEAVEAYAQARRRDPENLVLMTEQLVAGAEAQDLDATSDTLDAIEDRLNGFDGSQVEFADLLRERLDEADAAALRPPAMVLRNLLRPTDLYRLGLIPLTGGQQVGGPLFPQLDFAPPLPKSIQGGQDIEITFAEVSTDWAPTEVFDRRLALLSPALDRVDLLEIGSTAWRRLSPADDSTTGQPRPLDLGDITAALYQDVDQDAVSDLVGIDSRGGVWFFAGDESEGFDRGSRIFTSIGCRDSPGIFPLDIDHDGDLDLQLTCVDTPDVYLQNNGDGSWSDRTRELGLDLALSGSTGLAVADFDDDGDLDLVTVHADSPPRLYLNRRAGPLEESGAAWRLDGAVPPHRGVRTADFNQDGLFDLVLWGAAGGEIFLNAGDRFEPDSASQLPSGPWHAVELADFDNDGDQDMVIAQSDPDRLVLLRNRRDSFMHEEVFDGDRGPVSRFLTADFDRDGDLDLGAQLSDPMGRLAFWRNDGGNRNQWLGLRLVGRNDNNSKNNTQGLFTRLEVRIGDAYQVQIGNGGINHLGLGASRQADIIRVVWTNGLAQSWLRVSANRTLIEEQVLKGSCPFLYTWNGREFEFVTDLMWRSPLGMVLADGTAAPHQSARDYVLIRGEQLTPTSDEVWIQITEELWETVYVDDLELLAVDHPEGQELVVDEAFRPPPHPSRAPVHWIDRRLRPTRAVDQSGRDVLALITDRDERYVGDLPLSRYQGLTHGHSLQLSFEGIPQDAPLRLLLWGWVFPTDTTINFALHQNSQLDLRPPSLQVRTASGSWSTLVPVLGFPNGKRKAVVVELEQGQLADTAELRIPTNMQIYWDAAYLAVGRSRDRSRWTRLDPMSADLHYRGFSSMYRRSDSGPHLFDYNRVETAPRFRDLAGRYTRFGPVRTLLTEADDRYVVMNAGDELTIRFDTRTLPPLPAGWRRDWILFTDGWVKDGDIHTTRSQSVEPLPYHGMVSYPDTPSHSYPDSKAHRTYLQRFQTRTVTDEPFRSQIRRPATTLDGASPNG